MRIAICSRNRLFREGLACILKVREGCDIVAVANSAKDCLKASGRKAPQVMIVDREGSDQADLDYVVGAQFYHKFGTVLIISGGKDASGFDRIIRLGQSGFDLAKAVRAVLGPDTRRRSSRASSGRGGDNLLSPRESEIAALVAQGLSNKAIAAATGLQTVTVKNFVALIMRKLGCNNRVQVALELAKPSEPASADHPSSKS